MRYKAKTNFTLQRRFLTRVCLGKRLPLNMCSQIKFYKEETGLLNTSAIQCQIPFTLLHISTSTSVCVLNIALVLLSSVKVNVKVPSCVYSLWISLLLLPLDVLSSYLSHAYLSTHNCMLSIAEHKSFVLICTLSLTSDLFRIRLTVGSQEIATSLQYYYSYKGIKATQLSALHSSHMYGPSSSVTTVMSSKRKETA